MRKGGENSERVQIYHREAIVIYPLHSFSLEDCFPPFCGLAHPEGSCFTIAFRGSNDVEKLRNSPSAPSFVSQGDSFSTGR